MDRLPFTSYCTCSFCGKRAYTVELLDFNDVCVECIQKSIENTKEIERQDAYFHINTRDGG